MPEPTDLKDLNDEEIPRTTIADNNVVLKALLPTAAEKASFGGGPVDDSVTDDSIGNRTANPATAPTSLTAKLGPWISHFVNRYEAITGESWPDDPATTIAALVALIATKADTSYVDAGDQLLSGRVGAPVQDFAALRAVGSADRIDKQVRLVEDAGAQYRFDSAGTGADDGAGTIRPTDVAAPDPGRWFKSQAATQDHESLIGLLGGGVADHQHLTTAQVALLPSSGQKDALAGTSGAAGSGNKYVTDADARNTNARTPTAHTHLRADLPAAAAYEDEANTFAEISTFTKYQVLTRGSATSLAASQNDYALDSKDNPVVRLTSSANIDITGIAAATDRDLILSNIGSNNITLKNQDAGSTAVNRIITQTGGDYTIIPGASARLWYDGTTTRWRVLLASHRIQTFDFQIDGGGSVIAAGYKGYIRIDSKIRILGAFLESIDPSTGAALSGSIVVNLYRNGNATSIVAAAKPTLTAASSFSDNTLTGWTIDLDPGDKIMVRVESATTVKLVTLSLKVAG